MSTWTTPATWINGAVSAATMNTEVRDHLNWLKGFADLITASTASDVGTSTTLRIQRANTSDNAFRASVTGDTTDRLAIHGGGALNWSAGSGTAEVRLRRVSTAGDGRLQLDNGSGGGAPLEVIGSITAGKDTSDEIILQSGFVEMDTRAGGDPAAPNGGRFRLYCRDNGSGKAQAVLRFPTGNPFVIATQT